LEGPLLNIRTSLRTLAATLACAFVLALVAGSALAVRAQSVPKWNIAYGSGSEHVVQRASILNGMLNIDRTFTTNTAHVSVPLNTVTKISAPYENDNVWYIDFMLSKPATLTSVLHGGAVDKPATSKVSLSFLTKSDALAGRAYVLPKAHLAH
jgi:hypothetical protein